MKKLHLFGSLIGVLVIVALLVATLPLIAQTTVTAIDTYTLAVQVNGCGTTAPVVGLYEYEAEAVVALDAEPCADWVFNSWTGDVANPLSPTTTVTMDRDKSVAANFNQIGVGLESPMLTWGVNVTLDGAAAPIGTTIEVFVGADGTPDGSRDVLTAGEYGAILVRGRSYSYGEVLTYKVNGFTAVKLGPDVGVYGLQNQVVNLAAVSSPTPIEVNIDIKPGSDPNLLYLNSKGMLPVAILGTEDYDAMTIDPDTVRLHGIKSDGYKIRDVDHDGYKDMMVYFENEDIVATLGVVEIEDEILLQLIGELSDGTPISGEDMVVMAKKGKGKKKEKSLEPILVYETMASEVEPTSSTTTWTWSFGGDGFHYRHLPDAYVGQVILDDIDTSTMPYEVQGVFWYDCDAMEWKFWAPGAPGCTLDTLGGGHTFDYFVMVAYGACDWEIPITGEIPPPIPPSDSHDWTFCSAGYFPQHLPDGYTGEVVLDDLIDVPTEVQGVYSYDGNEWLFWAPGAPECTLMALGGGHTYDYAVVVTNPCEWNIPLP